MKLIQAKLHALLALTATIVFSFSGTALAGLTTEVVVNKSVIMSLKTPAQRISLANPAVADVILISPQQLQINGNQVGETSLIIWEKGNAKPSFFDLKVMGNQQAIESQIREIAPDDTIAVQYAGDAVILSGKAATEKTREKAEQIAKVYSPKVINYINVDAPQQVLLQVKVAQVDKTALKKLGFSAFVKQMDGEGFTNLIGAPTGGATRSITSDNYKETGSGTGISGNVVGLGSYSELGAYQLGFSYFPEGIGAVLQALSTKGLAKILAEPNLLVKSGQKGNFLAGSKIPYNIVTSTGGTATTSVVFVDVGVKLNFTPEVLDNGIINLKIDPAEVSSIAGTLEVNGYPIIDTRTVNTNVELKNGESLVLAGLLQEDHIRTMSKIPILGDIPILGALFRSTQNDLKEKELVFFITPKLVTPSAPGTKTELPTDKPLTPEQERELQWIPTGN